MTDTEPRVCARERCGNPLPPPARRGPARRWCSIRCRRLAYENRRAAATNPLIEVGSIAVVPISDTDRMELSPRDAAKIALKSLRASRDVLTGLRHKVDAGELDPSERAALVRDILRLREALKYARRRDLPEPPAHFDARMAKRFRDLQRRELADRDDGLEP